MLGPIQPPRRVNTPSYDSYLSGSPADAQVKTKPGLLLMGGGKDVDDAFRWLLDHAGDGDIVILRASGADGYNAYVQELGPVNSVESIVLKQREASSDPYVLERIKHADGIFFAGGDQSKYFQLIENSPLAQELNAAVDRGVPLGGTSAGLAIMGQMAFSARHGGLETQDVLKDPHSPNVTLEPSFLHLANLQGAITDTHFSQRERLGRLITFMDNLGQSGAPVKGVGVDEATAVLLEADGSGRVVGKNKAVFVTALDPGAPQRQYSVQEVKTGSAVDIAHWGESSGAAGFPRQTYQIRDSQLQHL